MVRWSSCLARGRGSRWGATSGRSCGGSWQTNCEWPCAIRGCMTLRSCSEQTFETEVTTMKTMKALWLGWIERAGQVGLALATMLTTQAALAVNDLPGGPAVNQLDLHPPVTAIAREQQWLHYFMMVICL